RMIDRRQSSHAGMLEAKRWLCESRNPGCMPGHDATTGVGALRNGDKLSPGICQRRGVKGSRRRYHQNTGTREIASRPAIDQLNAMRVDWLPRKRAIAVPNAAHIATDAAHAPANTLAITRVRNKASPSAVV